MGLKTILSGIFAIFFLNACSILDVYTKPKTHTNGLVISAKKDIKITQILVNNGACKMRLAGDGYIENNGKDLVLHGVIYSPKMQECTKNLGKLSLEILKNETNFDVITYDDCVIKSVFLKTNLGDFTFLNPKEISAKKIDELFEQSRKIRPYKDEPPRVELSDEELEEKARTCQPY